jgi:hypothetical protein
MIHELTIDLEKKIGTLRGSLNREFFLPVFLYFSTGDVVEIVPNGIMHHHIDTDTLTFKVSPRRTDTSTFKTSVQITITGTITKVFSFTTWPPPRHLLISTISEIGQFSFPRRHSTRNVVVTAVSPVSNGIIAYGTPP